jgi:hypothetical protein
MFSARPNAADDYARHIRTLIQKSGLQGEN